LRVDPPYYLHGRAALSLRQASRLNRFLSMTRCYLDGRSSLNAAACGEILLWMGLQRMNLQRLVVQQMGLRLTIPLWKFLIQIDLVGMVILLLTKALHDDDLLRLDL
jgi:hypothetical protein